MHAKLPSPAPALDRQIELSFLTLTFMIAYVITLESGRVPLTQFVSPAHS
jgi:hypothetical protein